MLETLLFLLPLYNNVENLNSCVVQYCDSCKYSQPQYCPTPYVREKRQFAYKNTACDPVADASPRYSLRCNVIVTARATILEIVKHVKCIKEVAAKDVTRTVPCMGPRRILAATATHPSSQPRLTGVPRETVSKMAQD